MKNKPHKLWVLFLTTLYISAFTFGGGFVIVTFMKHKFVDELHWINEQEMLDFTALAQSCPGAFVCDFFLGVNVVYIILVAACIGIIQFIWYQYKPFFLKRTQEKTQKQKCLQETKL